MIAHVDLLTEDELETYEWTHKVIPEKCCYTF